MCNLQIRLANIFAGWLQSHQKDDQTTHLLSAVRYFQPIQTKWRGTFSWVEVRNRHSMGQFGACLNLQNRARFQWFPTSGFASRVGKKNVKAAGSSTAVGLLHGEGSRLQLHKRWQVVPQHLPHLGPGADYTWPLPQRYFLNEIRTKTTQSGKQPIHLRMSPFQEIGKLKLI